jgi:glycosyltransferase involved in cell wall biosynthesis
MAGGERGYRPGHRLSAIVPVFNERENLVPLIQELRAELHRIGSPHEIILVDDGSTDGSSALLDSLAAAAGDLRILHLDSRRGQSTALNAGFEAARGDLLITLDGDLQYDPADISRLLEWIPEYDMVAGYRRRRRHGWFRRVSGRIAGAVRSEMLGDGIRDAGCSLKLFRRDLIRRMPRFDGMHRFLPLLARLQGASVAQIPVNHRPRRAGRSKSTMRNRLLRGLQDLHGVCWLKRRAIGDEVSWRSESPGVHVALLGTHAEDDRL